MKIRVYVKETQTFPVTVERDGFFYLEYKTEEKERTYETEVPDHAHAKRLLTQASSKMCYPPIHCKPYKYEVIKD